MLILSEKLTKSCLIARINWKNHDLKFDLCKCHCSKSYELLPPILVHKVPSTLLSIFILVILIDHFSMFFFLHFKWWFYKLGKIEYYCHVLWVALTPFWKYSTAFYYLFQSSVMLWSNNCGMECVLVVIYCRSVYWWNYVIVVQQI